MRLSDQHRIRGRCVLRHQNGFGPRAARKLLSHASRPGIGLPHHRLALGQMFGQVVGVEQHRPPRSMPCKFLKHFAELPGWSRAEFRHGLFQFAQPLEVRPLPLAGLAVGRQVVGNTFHAATVAAGGQEGQRERRLSVRTIFGKSSRKARQAALCRPVYPSSERGKRHRLYIRHPMPMIFRNAHGTLRGSPTSTAAISSFRSVPTTRQRRTALFSTLSSHG